MIPAGIISPHITHALTTVTIIAWCQYLHSEVGQCHLARTIVDNEATLYHITIVRYDINDDIWKKVSSNQANLQAYTTESRNITIEYDTILNKIRKEKCQTMNPQKTVLTSISARSFTGELWTVFSVFFGEIYREIARVRYSTVCRQALVGMFTE